MVVADTDAEAERLYGEHVEYCFGKGIGHLPLYRLVMPGAVPPLALKHLMATAPPPRQGPPSYRDLVDSGAVVAGSAATVRERLAHYARTFRVGNLALFLQLREFTLQQRLQVTALHQIDYHAGEGDDGSAFWEH